MRQLVCLVLIACHSSSAFADFGDVAVVTGVSFNQTIADENQLGFGSLGGVRFGVADDWRVFFEAAYSAFVGPGEPHDLLALEAGAAYLVDVAVWVPELFVGIGYFGPLASPGLAHDIGLFFGGGVEYRRYREFGVGLKAEYRVLLINLPDTAGVLSVAPYVSYHF